MSQLDRSAVSALATQTDELARQVAALADQVEGGLDSDAVGPLFEAERSLRMAGRALDRALRATGS